MTNKIEVDLAAVGLAINRIRARSVSEAHTSDISKYPPAKPGALDL
jgi:hypothetical protein